MHPKKTILAAAVLILATLLLRYLSHGEEVMLRKAFSTFPMSIGSWMGKEYRFDKKIYDILGVDDSILCNYTRHDGAQVQLYVGYYQSQREGDQIHSPRNCLPGAGWNIIRSSQEELIIPSGDPEKTRAVRLVLEKAGEKQIALYWFQSRGRFIASEYMQKIYHVVDSITRKRTDGAFVRLIAPVAENEERTVETLREFAGLLVPILMEYIPS